MSNTISPTTKIGFIVELIDI